MQTKGNPLHVRLFFSLSLFPLAWNTFEKLWKLFQYHAQFEKTLCVKKANKNNIIHIYTLSNSMCSVEIEFRSFARTFIGLSYKIQYGNLHLFNSLSFLSSFFQFFFSLFVDFSILNRNLIKTQYLAQYAC